MQITKLSIDPIQKGKVAIYVDLKYTFSVTESIIIKHSLFVGKEVTDEFLKKLNEIIQIQNLKDKVIGLIARRPRSEKEAKDYLKNKTSESIIKSVINELKEANYLNDNDFANWWIDQRTDFSNKSIKEIELELFKKGIDQGIINSLITKKIDPQIELNSAIKLANKKLKLFENKKIDRRKKHEKIRNYLMRKGFDWETITKTIDSINF